MLLKNFAVRICGTINDYYLSVEEATFLENSFFLCKILQNQQDNINCCVLKYSKLKQAKNRLKLLLQWLRLEDR